MNLARRLSVAALTVLLLPVGAGETHAETHTGTVTRIFPIPSIGDVRFQITGGCSTSPYFVIPATQKLLREQVALLVAAGLAGTQIGVQHAGCVIGGDTPIWGVFADY